MLHACILSAAQWLYVWKPGQSVCLSAVFINQLSRCSRCFYVAVDDIRCDLKSRGRLIGITSPGALVTLLDGLQSNGALRVSYRRLYRFRAQNALAMPLGDEQAQVAEAHQCTTAVMGRLRATMRDEHSFLVQVRTAAHVTVIWYP